MLNLKNPVLDIQLFADGAQSGAVSSSGNAAVKAEVAAPHSESEPSPTSKKKGVKADLSKVIYGKQDEAVAKAENSADSDKPDDKTASQVPTADKKAVFDELIGGEYRDEFSEKVAEIVKHRVKSSEETAKRFDELTPTLTMLYEKYGVKEGDIKALNKAIADDDAFYEAEAMERGVSVEQLKEFKKTQRENVELRRMQKERSAREGAERQYAAWMQQAEAAKQYYGSLELRTELQNPVFMRLLRSGIDVKTAFEVVHKDEIIPAAMQYTAKKVEEQMASKVKAAASRPSENGTASRSAAVVKSDVNSFSNDDLDEIIRRVRKGDKIKF